VFAASLLLGSSYNFQACGQALTSANALYAANAAISGDTSGAQYFAVNAATQAANCLGVIGNALGQGKGLQGLAGLQGLPGLGSMGLTNGVANLAALSQVGGHLTP
jgi:hypothetical protein